MLHVVDPATLRITGRLDLGLPGPAVLLLAGDHALVLAPARTEPAPPGGPARFPGTALHLSGGRTQLVLVDLAGTPRVISRYVGDGRLVGARQAGTTARIVLSNPPRIVFPLGAGAAPANEAAVEALPISAWLPGWEITTGATTTRGQLGCGSVIHPVAFADTALLTVLSIDLSAPVLGAGDPIGIVAGGTTVYATAASLYVAGDPVTAARMGSISTAIYRFALPAGLGRPTYAAVGTVPGTLLNSYAMSEWNGRLRVATASAGASAVRILREEHGKLAPDGAVSGLGAGEQIYAVRFVGPHGYVVTFRRTDPLYVLDLTDPAHPRATGSLKINGYSAFLQPVADGRLVGVGQAATVEGRPLGTQISLFEVADAAGPRRLARLAVPGTSSAAEFDPHALLWWPAGRLLVVPVSAAGSRETALATRVTGDGLQSLGRITVPSGTVLRQLVVGDRLWILTDSGLLATPLSELSTSSGETWLALR